MSDNQSSSALPDILEMVPLTRPVSGVVRVPGSKSITNRALVLAALSAPHICRLRGALRSDDTEVMVECLRRLGYPVRTQWPETAIDVGPSLTDRIVPLAEAELFVANSGTTMRFLTALVSLGRGRYRLDGVPRMGQRPIEDLLTALSQFGVNARSERDNGCPPVVIESKGWRGGNIRIRGDISSQFLSGLLMAAPRAAGAVRIEVEGTLVSEPYVDMTLAMMRQWGLEVRAALPTFEIPGAQQPRCDDYEIEPDASAASYFAGAAAISGGEVHLAGLHTNSLQGDVRFLDVLERMGCRVMRNPTGLTVRGGPLCGIDVDMNAISDCVMTLAAVACFAEGPTSIRNVAHIRHKETDRLTALATELRKLGMGVTEFADGLALVPGPLRGATMDTYDDHRMAMSLALVGLRVPGVVIRDPGCVAKTYPAFFSDLERMRT